jgi:hypothetical protein
MAESSSSSSSSSSPKGPFGQVVTAISLILVVLFLAKVYLRDPEYRHVEVCYLPYKISHIFWVDVWGAIVTDDTATQLKHSRDITSFFISCTDHVGQFTWLRTMGSGQ